MNIETSKSKCPETAKENELPIEINRQQQSSLKRIK